MVKAETSPLRCSAKSLLFFREKLPEVQLDQTALHLLLRKSSAAICAHVGYKGHYKLLCYIVTRLIPADFIFFVCQ